MNKGHSENYEAACCINYCSRTHLVAGQEVVNNFRCHQAPFSTTDLWRLRKNKKETTIRINIQ